MKIFSLAAQASTSRRGTVVKCPASSPPKLATIYFQILVSFFHYKGKRLLQETFICQCWIMWLTSDCVASQFRPPTIEFLDKWNCTIALLLDHLLFIYQACEIWHDHLPLYKHRLNSLCLSLSLSIMYHLQIPVYYSRVFVQSKICCRWWCCVRTFCICSLVICIFLSFHYNFCIFCGSSSHRQPIWVSFSGLCLPFQSESYNSDCVVPAVQLLWLYKAQSCSTAADFNKSQCDAALFCI